MDVIVLIACGVAAGVSLIAAVIGVTVTRGFRRNGQNPAVRLPDRQERKLAHEAEQPESRVLNV